MGADRKGCIMGAARWVHLGLAGRMPLKNTAADCVIRSLHNTPGEVQNGSSQKGFIIGAARWTHLGLAGHMGRAVYETSQWDVLQPMQPPAASRHAPTMSHVSGKLG